jgi:hypothetical protein
MTGRPSQSVIAADPAFTGPHPIRLIIILLLVVSLSGLSGLTPLATASSTDTVLPILRHSPHARLALGETLPIRVAVESGGEIKEVTLWYRAPGGETFQEIPMTNTSENIYEVGIVMTEVFKKGIEYYIEAADRFGNRGTDGAKTLPYFVEIIPELGPEAPSIHRPWWKNPWFWAGVALVIGVGAIVLRNDRKNQGSGTVVVQ